MTSLFRPRASFLQNTAWQNQALNALHYNTSQQGSVLPLIYGTMRQQINLIDMNNYRGPKGKKGKTGSLPISGTSRAGKGGGSSKGKGSKKNGHYTINVDFAMCQGPVTFNSNNAVYSSSGIESFSVSGLNFHDGHDGQAADTVFNQVAYSATCHITGTPMDLGQSPVVPNIAFEITGLLAGLHTGGYSRDANPADVIQDFLTNPRYGAAFPPECVAVLPHDDAGDWTNTYGDYCQAASLLISVSLDGHQKAIEWLSGIVTLTNSALVWSGKLLNIVPYGDLALSNNGASWTPNFTPQYNLTDHDFLPWNPRAEGAAPNPGDDDPIIMTRSNPADADNWVSMEYMDRTNFYNSTIITAYDQGAIDTYGLRIGDSLPGRSFTNPNSAQTALQLILQRRLYIRNTDIKFQVGWQFALLEPMDMVSLTGRAGDNYLNQYPVRIKSIEENDNGDLTIIAEDPQPGIAFSAGPIATYWRDGAMMSCWGGSTQDPVYDWNFDHPIDSPKGTFSVMLQMENYPVGPISGSIGIIRTSSTNSNYYTSALPNALEFVIAIAPDYSLFIYLHGVQVYRSPANVIQLGVWQHLLVTWDLPNSVSFWCNGVAVVNRLSSPILPGGAPTVMPSMVYYSHEGFVMLHSSANAIPQLTINYSGCANNVWWDTEHAINDPSVFIDTFGVPKSLGVQGEGPTGSPPWMYLYWRPNMTNPGDWTPDIIPGMGTDGYAPTVPPCGYYGLNRAGYKFDDTAYWFGVNGSPNASFGDPAHPNLSQTGNRPDICTSNSWR